jgi:CheY-like chemotaxis protein
VQRYFRFLLELDQYSVETADNGEEALERVREGPAPGVVLLDMQMPGMDGLETLRSLRQLQPNLKVVICSGEENPDKIGEAVRLGAQAYLVKPVSHLYLSAALDRCFTPNQAKQSRKSRSARVLVLPSRPGRPD